MTDIDRLTFRDEVRAAGDKLSPARAALLFAREIAYPNLRPSEYLTLLDDYALAAQRTLAPHRAPEARGLALAEYVFQTLGFRGNSAEYYEPRNSYLNQVLERRTGLPITLSVVFIEMGWRLGLPVSGVGLPGHFIVSIDGQDAPVYLDPFNGGARLTLENCADLVRAASGHEGVFDIRWLAPAAPLAIVERMLNNLRNIYMQREDWAPAIAVVERLRELRPDVHTHLRDLGLLHYRRGALRAALRLFDQYLARAPRAQDFDSVRQSRNLLLEHLARLN